MGSPDSVLRLEGIRKRWPGMPAPVLDGVTLDVARGECVGVTGRNGAGKTTLLRIAAGLIIPDAGNIRAGELEPEGQRTAYHRRIGFLSAGNSGLYARLHVQQHLDFWARLSMLPSPRRREAIERALDRFELRALGGKRVDRLSMGQRQRLRLALAFLHEPLVVLLDEPRTSLDDEGVALLSRAVDDLRVRGGAAVVCAPSREGAGVALDREVVVAGGAVRPAA